MNLTTQPGKTSSLPQVSHPLKIAQVTAIFPPHLGGSANVCFYNSRELAQLGHEVHVFTAASANLPTYEVQQGVHIHRLRPVIKFGNASILPGLFKVGQGFD